MHLFYLPRIDQLTTELPEEEARHAVGVLRSRVGDVIGLLDGKGTTAEAEITEADRRTCSIRVCSITRRPPERKATIHLAVAPTKQMERFEWMLEKCTEIGVDRITPLITDRTERERLRRDRLERVLTSAMKQSQRSWLPQLDEPMSLDELIAATAVTEQRLFGWCEGDRRDLPAAYRADRTSLLLIGPEGDFTSAEAHTLAAASFTPVSLGEARLRTETAAIAACTWMNFAQLAR